MLIYGSQRSDKLISNVLAACHWILVWHWGSCPAFQISVHWRTLEVLLEPKLLIDSIFTAPKMIEYRPDDSDDYCSRSLYGSTIHTLLSSTMPISRENIMELNE